MRLKSVLMASCAGAFAFSGIANAGGLYGTITGGYDLPKAKDIHTGSTHSNGTTLTAYNANFQVENGFMVSVAIGWDLSDVVTKGLRVELEGAYRHDNMNGKATMFLSSPGGSSGHSAVNADLTTWSLLANAWYNVDTGTRWTPYFGGGIGWGRSKFVPEFTASPYVTQEAEGFAWQAGVGLNFNITPHAAIGVGYRYFDAPDVTAQIPTFGVYHPGLLPFKEDGVHQDVVFSLSYDL